MKKILLISFTLFLTTAIFANSEIKEHLLKEEKQKESVVPKRNDVCKTVSSSQDLGDGAILSVSCTKCDVNAGIATVLALACSQATLHRFVQCI